MLNVIKGSLSKKILIVLSVSAALIMTGVIYFTYSFETDAMLKTMDLNSRETASAIYAGIKYPMSVGDSGAVEKQLLDIKTLTDTDIYICDINRTVTFSSRSESIRSDMEGHIANTDAREALRIMLQSGLTTEKGYPEESGGKKYLTHIHAIPNQKECFRCHGSGKKVLGAIISKKSVDHNYAAIANIRDTNIMMSILGVCAIVLIAHLQLVKFVTRPIKVLAHDIKHLPEQLSEDHLTASVNIVRADEIGTLQKSFSDMTVELFEKRYEIQKSNNDLATANRELEAFAYSVSHDLRAPLRNIDGFSKILLDEYTETLDERAKHYLARVRNGTERMSLLIDDMLTFSRIGRAELQFRRMRCTDIINPILEYYTPEIEKRKVSFVLQELPEINCDPVLMQSLFSNLIANAFKYSRHVEYPEITIGYDRDRKAIFVKDNGVGFEMKYHDKVFQVFQRLHLPEEYEGTGIGLAIVKRIAERHQGRVWAESEPGKGAVFYIDLPLFKEV